MRDTSALTPTPLPSSQEAILLVDVLNLVQFPGAARVLDGLLQAFFAIQKLKNRMGKRAMVVVYANDTSGIWHSECSDLQGRCQALKGLCGAIAKLLAPKPSDLAVLKPQHSGLRSTPLQQLLCKMGVKKLVIAGCVTDMGVFTTTNGSMLGFQVAVPAESTASLTPMRKSAASGQLLTAFGYSIAKAR